MTIEEHEIYIAERPESDQVWLARLVSVVMAIWAVLLIGDIATATRADAMDSPCDIHIDFSGDRLLNNGSDNVGALHSVHIPDDFYDVTLTSSDFGHETMADPSQTQEQWWFIADGVRVALSEDIATSVTTSSITYRGIRVPESEVVWAEHLGEGNVNSVDPVGVCLVRRDLQQEVDETEQTFVHDDQPLEVDIAEAESKLAGDETGVDGAEPIEIESGEPEFIEVEVQSTIEVAETVVNTGETDPVKAPDAIPVADDGAAQLALTGLSDVLPIALAGGTLIIAGGACIFAADRRRWAV